MKSSSLKQEHENFDHTTFRSEHLTTMIQWSSPNDEQTYDCLPELTPIGKTKCPVIGRYQHFLPCVLWFAALKNKEPGRGLIQPLSKLTVSSECHLCGSRFINKSTTTLHMHGSLLVKMQNITRTLDRFAGLPPATVAAHLPTETPSSSSRHAHLSAQL